jgi:methyl-accepting chemotaxis protein
MLKRPSRRTAGVILSILAALGIIFSLAGIASIWILRPRVTKALGGTLETLQAALGITGSGIGTLRGTLQGTKEDFVLLQSSLDNIQMTAESTSDSLEASANLVGDDLTLTITDTQTALDSAAASAELIDDTLDFLAAIPLLGLDYQPDTPLHLSLTQISSGLEEVPEQLQEIETNLNTTATGLDTFAADLGSLSESLAHFTGDLDDAEGLLDDYDLILTDATGRLTSLQNRLPALSIFASSFLSGMLLWLGVAQVNVLLRGQDYVHHEVKVVNISDLNRE